jgi:hypothetical protein
VTPYPSSLIPKGVARLGGCRWQDRLPASSPISPDNQGRSLEIPGNSDPNIIPDGDFNSFVRVTGGECHSVLLWWAPWTHVKPVDPYFDPLILNFSFFSSVASDALETLGSEGALSPGGLASLLRLPQGCAEQTMIYLAPTLAASRYLDKTEQWSKLPPETKDRAVDLIQKGSWCRGRQEWGLRRAINGRGEAQKAREGKQGNGECGFGHTEQKSGCQLSNCLSSPRLHANPAVSEDRWFLWGLVTPRQQHLVRGSAAVGFRGVRAMGR